MLKRGAHRNGAIEREHARLAEQSLGIAAELQIQAEEIIAREDRGAPTKRFWRNLDRLRDRYWSVESRRRKLQKLLPELPPPTADF